MPSVQAGRWTAADAWNRIYSITSFFVGASDDLTPYQYLEAVQKVFGSDFDASALADDSKLLDLKAELASLPNPQINGGTGECTVAAARQRDRASTSASTTARGCGSWDSASCRTRRSSRASSFRPSGRTRETGSRSR